MKEQSYNSKKSQIICPLVAV